jgi:hypothetical protein
MINQKGHALILAVVVVVLVVGAVIGVREILNNQNSKLTKPTQPTNQPTAIPSLAPTSSPVVLHPLTITNWKTLNFQDFSLKHPSSWKEGTKSGGCLSELDINMTEAAATWICINGPLSGTLQQRVDEISKNLTNVKQKIIVQKNFKYNDLSGVELETSDELPAVDAYVTDSTFKDPTFLQLTLYSHNQISDQDKQLFETVISTVTFHLQTP